MLSPRTKLTKRFPFSASYASNGKVYGHNYVLEATFDYVDPAAEARIEKQIKDSLISKMESKDLGLHVDFLKGVTIREDLLLETFFRIAAAAIAPARILSLSLERDAKTKFTLHPAP